MIETYRRRLLFAVLIVISGIILWFWWKWLWETRVLADPDTDIEPTSTISATAKPSPTGTVGKTPNATPPDDSIDPSPTDTVGNTPNGEGTPSGSGSPTPKPTNKPTEKPVKPTPTGSVGNTPTATVKPTSTPKPTVKPTATNTPKPTVKPTPTPKPTATVQPKPSNTPDKLPDQGEIIKNDKNQVTAIGINPYHGLDLEVPTEVNPDWVVKDTFMDTQNYNGVQVTRINFGIHDYDFRANWDGSRFTMQFFGALIVLPLNYKPNDVTIHFEYYGSERDWDNWENSYYWFNDFTVSVNGKVVYYNNRLTTPCINGFQFG